MKVVTIADVAAAAGVSMATVSRVLSGSAAPMRASTRTKVEAAVAALDFHPNAAARSLTGRRTFTVGVLVSDIGNPFYAEVIKGVEDAGLPRGYSLFLGNTNFDLERGSVLIRSLIDRRVDAVILLFSEASEAWLSALASHDIPVCVVDRDPAQRPLEAVAVTVAFEPGIRCAVDHLIALGHRRFAHVSGPLGLHTSLRRRDIFLEALAAHGIAPGQVAVAEGDFHIEGGRKAAATLLEARTPPTAIFAANDLMAIGVLAEAQDRGLSLPRELSVVGLDDIWQAAHCAPPLTTVSLPRYAIGFQAMTRLMDRSKTSPAGQEDLHLDSGFVLRGSTAAPPPEA